MMNKLKKKLDSLGYKYNESSDGIIDTGRPYSKPSGELMACGISIKKISGSTYVARIVPLKQGDKHIVLLKGVKPKAAPVMSATSDACLVTAVQPVAESDDGTGAIVTCVFKLDKTAEMLDIAAAVIYHMYSEDEDGKQEQ